MTKLGLKCVQLGVLLGLLALAACGGDAPAGKVTLDWLTNLDEARQAGLQKNRPVFIAFVGLDWSAPSQGIMKDVFETPEFKSFADNNLVLVRIDLARQPQSQQIAQNNEALAEKVQIDGLPVALLWDPARNHLIGRLNGYGGNGPTPYLQQVAMRLEQWQQSLAQSPPEAAPAATIGTPGAPAGVPQLSAPPAGAPGMAGVPVATPQDLQRQQAMQAAPMPSSLSVVPSSAPGPSSSLPTLQQMQQQVQQQVQQQMQQVQPAPAPASSTDLPLLNATPLK